MKIGTGFFGCLFCIVLFGCSHATERSYMDSGYTKEQLEAMGVNTEHLFVFTEERATYGYPLNSYGDDFGMTFEGPHNRGYFSSNRGDGRGWDHIYMG